MNENEVMELIKNINYGWIDKNGNKHIDDFENYADDYKRLLVSVIERPELPIVFNLNVVHAVPRCIIPFGIDAFVDTEGQVI